MTFRNPMYLDLPLLKNLADYYGVDVPTTQTVTQRRTGASNKKIGVNKVLETGIQSTTGDETTSEYSTEVRPVRLVNDVIDQLLTDGDIVDLDQNPDAVLTSGQPLQVTGALSVSLATEIGTFMEKILPIAMSQYGEGKQDLDLVPADMAQLLMAPQTEGVQVYNLDTSSESRLVMILDPRNIPEGRSCDDLEGEFTIFGTVDRIISDSSRLSLTRYLLPGLNRSLRRRVDDESLNELLEGFGKITGRSLDSSALYVEGPGLLIKSVAIY